MRLIDADEAYKVLTKYYHHRTEEQSEALKEALGRVPTAEIVRCKDCKHSSYCYSEVHMLNKRRSTNICKDISFCSFAERRTDG